MNTPFTLTTQQINFFKTFGFLKLKGLLTDDIAYITDTFEQMYAQNLDDVIDWRHEAHYMQSRRVLLQLIERDEKAAAIIDDPRIDSVFSGLLGNDYIYRASEGNIFTGDTYWHSDLYNANFKYQHLKMALYLDPIDADSGAFRAIPGSHLFGDQFANMVERWVWKHEENFGLSKTEVPSVVIPTQPGDVLLFDYRLKHATCNSGERRRMLTICASEHFADEDRDSLKKMLQDLKKIAGCVYREPMLKNAPEARMKHLQQCLECSE